MIQPRPYRLWWPLLFVILWVIGRPNQMSATEFRSNDAINISNVEVLDDLFVAGEDVHINAAILGDLFAAGQTITIGDSADIDNSIMAAGQRIDIGGRTRNSVRLAGQSVTIRGHIERNLLAYGQDITIDKSGWVEKDATIFGASIIVRGRVGGRLNGSCGTTTISGQIDGDVDLECAKVVILSDAIIGGHLTVVSTEEPSIEDGAEILGGVSRVEPEDKASGYSLGDFVYDVWWFLARLLTGALLIVMFRKFVVESVACMSSASIRSLGIGFLFLICLPIAAVVLGFTVIGIPLGAITLLGWLLLIYLSPVFVGLALGDMLLGRRRIERPMGSFVGLFIGLLIVSVVTAIPYAGLLAKLIVWSTGLGGFLLTAYHLRMKSQSASEA